MCNTTSFEFANNLFRLGRYLEAYLIYTKLASKKTGFKYYRINKDKCHKKVFRIKPQHENKNQIKKPESINNNNVINKFMAIERLKRFDTIVNLPEICRDQKIKLLIAKPCGIGNMIMFLPSLRCMIDHLDKKTEITVLCHKSDSLVISEFPINVDLFPTFESANERIEQFSIYLKKIKYDVVIYPPFTSLYPPKNLDGHKSLHIQHPQIDFQERHEAIHNFELLSMIGIDSSIKEYLPELKNFFCETPSSESNYFVIHAGSSASTHMRKKRWPASYWAKLACALSDMAPVCFVGSDDDKLEFEKIYRHLPCKKAGIYNLIGAFNWSEMKELIAAATVFISNDSGIMHLASTTNTPIVSIFGPTDPVKNAPFRFKNVSVVTAPKNIICAPCYVGKNKSLWACDQQICLESIEPELVLSEIRKFLI